MRKLSLSAVLVAGVATSFLAWCATAQAQMVDGQVTKIDPPAEKITIRHGPIKKFEMDDGMTMVFRVADPAMLKVVKVGDKVKFDVERVNGQFTVIKLEKAK
jgi:Cu(I)/Ag(I) efflux system protein CusF